MTLGAVTFVELAGVATIAIKNRDGTGEKGRKWSEKKGKERAGRRSTSRIKKLINKEEEFSRPALEPPFGLHPLRRSTVSRTLRVSANVPADTCCCVAPSAATTKRETEKRMTTKEWGGNWRHSLNCFRRRLSHIGLAPFEFDGRFAPARFQPSATTDKERERERGRERKREKEKTDNIFSTVRKSKS